MSEELQMITEDAEDGMKKAISHLEVELTKIRAGKANPSMLDGINVDFSIACNIFFSQGCMLMVLTSSTLIFATCAIGVGEP